MKQTYLFTPKNILLSFLSIALLAACVTKKKIAPAKKQIEKKEVASDASIDGPRVDQKAVIAAGKQLCIAKCAKCHELYKGEEFNATQWHTIMIRMQKQANLSDAERLQIETYLVVR
jgi:hypothetical protein